MTWVAISGLAVALSALFFIARRAIEGEPIRRPRNQQQQTTTTTTRGWVPTLRGWPYSPMVAGAFALVPLGTALLWGMGNLKAFLLVLLAAALMGFSNPKVRRRRTSHESQVGFGTLAFYAVMFFVWVFDWVFGLAP